MEGRIKQESFDTVVTIIVRNTKQAYSWPWKEALGRYFFEMEVSKAVDKVGQKKKLIVSVVSEKDRDVTVIVTVDDKMIGRKGKFVIDEETNKELATIGKKASDFVRDQIIRGLF